MTPRFGSQDGVSRLQMPGAEAVGGVVNLAPHTVFNTPVKLFIPIPPNEDIESLGLAYHDGSQWRLAVDAAGNVLPGGEGWMVPDSRVDHTESSPALIEVQVHHFSAAQAVLFPPPDDNDNKDDEIDRDTGNANIVIFANCFINSVSPDSKPVPWFIALLLNFLPR